MPPLIGTDSQPEQDQLRIPTAAGYIDYPLANLIYVTGGPLRSTSNFGLPPIRFIAQRGPFQDGETPSDLRLDPRVIQIEIVDWLCDRAEFWTRRNELLDLLRPNRAFAPDGTYSPLIYRKFFPGGKVERGSDMATTAGSDIVISPWGRFVHYGGLQAGDTIALTSGADAGTYTITEVGNDYTLTLDTGGVGLTTTAPQVGPPIVNPVSWRYVRNRSTRDLSVLLEQGPVFNEQIGAYRAPQGYREALRFVAHDPVWYGVTQEQTWGIEGALGDLVFDGFGAWFGASPGAGRWLFSTSYVGETVRLVYWGTWAAKPIITITGPAANPIIENTTLGVRLELAYSAVAGEIITINTQLLTCTNNFGANLLPYLTGDLATFALEGDPQGATLAGYPVGRVNSVTVNFANATVASRAALTWRNRYIGI